MPYAKCRICESWLRQAQTAFGAVTIMILADSWVKLALAGLTLAGLALLGEAFELALLTRVLH